MRNSENSDGRDAFWDSFNSKELHRLLFKEAPDNIFIADHQGRFLSVNSCMTRLTGYSEEELLGIDITDLIPPEDLDRQPVPVEDLTQSKFLIKEQRLRRKDGSLLPVESRFRLLFDGHFLGIILDIKDRKRAETVSEQRIQELAALQSLGLAVSSLLSIKQVYAVALQGMLEAAKPDIAFLFHREGERLLLQELLPPEARQRMGAMSEHRVGECICGLSVREGKPLFSRNIHDDPRCTWKDCKRIGIQSFASLPLRVGWSLPTLNTGGQGPDWRGCGGG